VDHVVGEMPHAAHHTLLHRPRIRTDLEHLNIVIRLEQQDIGPTQMMADVFRQIAQVGRDRYFDTLSRERKAHGVRGVMRNGEARDIDIAD
jgi:hypothetical protein